MKKAIIFSGIQPSGKLTIGNYIGALKQWQKIQDTYQCIYCIVDLHAMTVSQNIHHINKISLDTLALYLSCGIDPNKSIIFIQSHVFQHTQLSWILSCYSYFNEMRRMTQFKNRISRYSKSVNIGLLSYPILMAADILLYNTNKVPVGLDQKQHLELTRNIANRFNNIYGKIFNVPDIMLSKIGSNIKSLRNPKIKMSKSDTNSNNVIYLLENINSMKQKINYAVTDSNSPPSIYYDQLNKPGISNLLNILSCMKDIPILDLEKYFEDKKYFQLKQEVIEVITAVLSDIQCRYFILRKDKNYLHDILHEGAKQANLRAQNTLEKVYKAINLS